MGENAVAKAIAKGTAKGEKAVVANVTAKGAAKKEAVVTTKAPTPNSSEGDSTRIGATSIGAKHRCSPLERLPAQKLSRRHRAKCMNSLET